MPDATVVHDGVRVAVRLERRLTHPPSRVWRALTDREGLRTWFPCDVVVEGGTWEVGEERLRFELSPEGNGTRLVLINSLHPAAAARNAAGRDDCLDRLEGRSPSPDGWRTRFDAYCSAFTPELGPQDGPPAGYRGDAG